METSLVGYNGVCPICSSADGTIVQNKDGRYRNICRRFGCPAFYRPAPFDGYSKQEDAVSPFDSDLFNGREGVTVDQYMNGFRDT